MNIMATCLENCKVSQAYGFIDVAGSVKAVGSNIVSDIIAEFQCGIWLKTNAWKGEYVTSPKFYEETCIRRSFTSCVQQG